MRNLSQSKKFFDLKRNSIAQLLIFGSLITTILVSPWNFDPVSLPKMSLVTTIAILGYVLHLRNLKYERNKIEKDQRYFDFLLISLLILIFVNLFVNNDAFSERLFGIGSRNTGVVTLSSFIVICFLASRYVLSIESNL